MSHSRGLSSSPIGISIATQVRSKGQFCKRAAILISSTELFRVAKPTLKATHSPQEVQSSRFTTALRKWADDNGEFSMGAKEIKSRMEAKGFTLKPRTAGNYWLGITVVNKYDPVSVDDFSHRMKLDPREVM